MGLRREGVCEGQSEEQHLMEARAEVVLMSVAQQDPAAAVLTVADERVGPPEVVGWFGLC